MRLPADATLLVIGALEAIDDPCSSPGGGPIEARAAALIAIWRREGLPLVHVRCDRPAPDSPFISRRHFRTCAAPLEGETVIGATAASAFVDTWLEDMLDDVGATTLVLCGALKALQATARHAGDLGYRIFIVADACWGAAGALGESLAGLHGETATIVDTAATLSAAATAKARQRREAGRAG
jgi:nicotinamidase-related amidase